jgi:hypothetical protein
MGPTVWELEGPMPILNSSKRLVFTLFILGFAARVCGLCGAGGFLFGLLLLNIVVGGGEGAGDERVVGFVEMDEGHAHSSPATLDGREGVRAFGDEGLLLVGSKFEYAVTAVLCGESCEDAIVEAKVRMVHVRTFDRFGKLEGELAEEFDT